MNILLNIHNISLISLPYMRRYKFPSYLGIDDILLSLNVLQSRIYSPAFHMT